MGILSAEIILYEKEFWDTFAIYKTTYTIY